MDACARTEAAILRAQALFSPSAEPAATGAAPLTAAATSAGTAGTTMGTQSGHSAQAHTGLINQTVPHLTRAAGNDTTLQQLTTQAAQVSHTGATQLDTVLQKVKSTTAFAATAKTHAAQLSAYKALQNHVNDASNIVKNASSASDQLATDARNLTYSTDKDTPGPHIQMVDDKTGDDPPHGKDPRYWIDVTKIVHVPDGQLAPSGSTQIGPNMYYPTNNIPGAVMPPPPAAKYPLGFGDIQRTGPGELPDYNHSPVAPGWAYPRPNPYNVEPPWPAPQRPIDIRDIIEVAPGAKAPWGYSEYAPGWFAPDPAKFGPR